MSTNHDWLNLVEVFFGIITRQAIRWGSYASVPELVAAIETFIDGAGLRTGFVVPPGPTSSSPPGITTGSS